MRPQELGRLLQEERLAGATLLIMANKQDVPGALSKEAIREVSVSEGCVAVRAWQQARASAGAGGWPLRPPYRRAAVTTPPPPQALRLDALVGRQWMIVACSAVDGSGLLEGFDWLVKDIAARIYLLE